MANLQVTLGHHRSDEMVAHEGALAPIAIQASALASGQDGSCKARWGDT